MVEFVALTALPSGVLGPEDFRAFLRLAARRAGLAITKSVPFALVARTTSAALSSGQGPRARARGRSNHAGAHVRTDGLRLPLRIVHSVGTVAVRGGSLVAAPSSGCVLWALQMRVALATVSVLTGGVPPVTSFLHPTSNRE